MIPFLRSILRRKPKAKPIPCLHERLGSDAAALFIHSKAMVEFLLATIGDKDPALAGQITSRIASMPATTVHADGTVTID